MITCLQLFFKQITIVLFQVFQLSDGTYESMFHFLWSLKRVEYCMSNFRKEQTCTLKIVEQRIDFTG